MKEQYFTSKASKSLLVRKHQNCSVYGTNSHLFLMLVWQNGLTGYQYSGVWGAEAPSIRNKLFTEVSKKDSKSDPPVLQKKGKKRKEKKKKNSDLFSFVEAFLAKVFDLLSSGVLESQKQYHYFIFEFPPQWKNLRLLLFWVKPNQIKPQWGRVIAGSGPFRCPRYEDVENSSSVTQLLIEFNIFIDPEYKYLAKICESISLASRLCLSLLNPSKCEHFYHKSMAELHEGAAQQGRTDQASKGGLNSPIRCMWLITWSGFAAASRRLRELTPRASQNYAKFYNI